MRDRVNRNASSHFKVAFVLSHEDGCICNLVGIVPSRWPQTMVYAGHSETLDRAQNSNPFWGIWLTQFGVGTVKQLRTECANTIGKEPGRNRASDQPPESVLWVCRYKSWHVVRFCDYRIYDPWSASDHAMLTAGRAGFAGSAPDVDQPFQE